MRPAGLLVVLVIAGCASPPAPPPPPAAVLAPPAAAPIPPPPPPDACGAGQHQDLVGRSRTEIPVPIRPELQRVACDRCAITMDVNPNRLNFFFDAASGRITKVSCG